MLITPASLDTIFNAFKLTFQGGFDEAESHWADIAMQVSSSTEQETYAWMGQMPSLREWRGDRILKGVSAYGYTIVNRLWESTVPVPRTKIEDDSIGLFKPMFAMMGQSAKTQPYELIFGLLNAGMATPCYDGRYFFDPEHPTFDKMGSDTDATGAPLTVSNIQTPSQADTQAGIQPCPSWYLLDTSRPLKPFIFQERLKPEFTALTRPEEGTVFWKDQYVYGTRARNNVGFGLWQMAQMSTAPLTGSYYGQLRTAMTTLRGDGGRLLALKGTTLVVPPALEEAGRTLLNSAVINASSNPWVGSAKLVIAPWLAD